MPLATLRASVWARSSTMAASSTAVRKPNERVTNATSLSTVLGMPTTASGWPLRVASRYSAAAPRIVPSPPIVNRTFTPRRIRLSTARSMSTGPREVPKTVPPIVWMRSTSSEVSTSGSAPRAGSRPW